MTIFLNGEKRVRIYGPFFLSVFLLVFFFAELINVSVIGFSCSLIPVFYSIFSWELARWLVMRYRKRMPGINQVKRRIYLIILLAVPASATVGIAGQLFMLWLGLYRQLSPGDYLFVTGLNILCCALAVCVYESYYYLQELKVLLNESENLKKQNSNSQFQFLREQIKPHFLFNSLNALSALIITDPVKAELYVEEMSTVYRYLLSKNEKALTTLKEELSFLDSYLLLLKVRFEQSLNVNIHTSEHLQERLIPPFVLQLLIENAVKHNIISREHPLSVEIYTDETGNLHVDNNMQLKARPDPSENTGLANIRSRFALLNKAEGFKVVQEDNFFKVTIPLLKINRYPVVFY